jgi:hypothetical protein
LKDCGIAHCAIDSDHENAILKRFIAVATPDVAKTLDFFVRASVPRGSSLRKFKDFAAPLQRCSHRALPSLRRTSASSAAPFIPTTRDHYGVLRIPYALALSAWIVSLFYGSVRAVKVLLASLRSTLTPTSSAGKRSVGFHAKKFVAAENEANGSVPRTKPLQLLTKMSRSFILQDAILDRRWIRGLVQHKSEHNR